MTGFVTNFLKPTTLVLTRYEPFLTWSKETLPSRSVMLTLTNDESAAFRSETVAPSMPADLSSVTLVLITVVLDCAAALKQIAAKNKVKVKILISIAPVSKLNYCISLQITLIG